MNRQFLRLAMAAFVAASALGVPASAHAGGATVVHGHQSSPVASCMGESSPNGTFEMTGDLVGCWYIDTLVTHRFNANGSAAFSGTEHFTGCLDRGEDGVCGTDDPWGTFHTTFTFTAKFDTTTGAEIHGRCHHPIVGGSGDFTGATGVLNFHDIVTPTEVSADYYGPIRF